MGGVSNKMAFWTIEKVEALATLWESKKELYDVKSKDYKDRNKRKLACQEIAQALETTGECDMYVCVDIYLGPVYKPAILL